VDSNIEKKRPKLYDHDLIIIPWKCTLYAFLEIVPTVFPAQLASLTLFPGPPVGHEWDRVSIKNLPMIEEVVKVCLKCALKYAKTYQYIPIQ